MLKSEKFIKSAIKTEKNQKKCRPTSFGERFLTEKEKNCYFSNFSGGRNQLKLTVACWRVSHDGIIREQTVDFLVIGSSNKILHQYKLFIQSKVLSHFLFQLAHCRLVFHLEFVNLSVGMKNVASEVSVTARIHLH